MKVFAFVFLLLGATAALRVSEGMRENPIRRVVTMLQNLQKEAEAEGEKEQELMEKFQCYCKSNSAALDAAIAESSDAIPQLESEIKEMAGEKSQLSEDLIAHKDSRSKAEESMEKATSQREKEAASFAAESTELKNNIEAAKKAVDAISKGMAGAFLQTSAANVLKKVVMSSVSMTSFDRDELTAFLSTSTEYAPQSGEIVGIVKQLQEDMENDLKDATDKENQAIADYESLMTAKSKEVKALTAMIEEKTGRLGEVSVTLVQKQNDLEDSQEELASDQGYAAELKKSCDSKAKEHEERKVMRAQEIEAIGETIKILNSDDALDLFKKTLPGPAESFLQVAVTETQVKKMALEAVQKLAATHNPQVDAILLALQSKKVDMSGVIKMIDEMVVTLKKEQTDDEAQKGYCEKEMDVTEDKIKELQHEIAGHSATIADGEDSVKTVTNEIAALVAGIKALDKSVTEATEQRKDENAEYVKTAGDNKAALELLAMAKNTMNKVYNPKLHTTEAPKQLTEAERIEQAYAFVQIRAHLRSKAAPPPPPETFDAYEKKDASGPIALLDLLMNDLSKDMQAAEMEEKNAASEYEKLMADSKKKRAVDSKSITEKESQKADMEAEVAAAKKEKKGAEKDLLATGEYMKDMHLACDFLIDNFQARKDARADEMSALEKAKAVLSGADFEAFIQTKRSLRRHH